MRRLVAALALCSLAACSGQAATSSPTTPDDDPEASASPSAAAGSPSCATPCASAPASTGAGQASESETVDVLTLQVGDCFDDSDGDSAFVSEVRVVPCDDAHDNEVYALIHYVGDGEYPGSDQLEEYAVDQCLGRFDGFVGIAYDESSLDYAALWPSEDTWGRGDRSVVCFLYDLDYEKLTGSMRDSGV